MTRIVCCALVLLFVGCTSTEPQRSTTTSSDRVLAAESVSATPSEAALKLLRKREGFRRTVYPGIETGKPTAGSGHVLTAAEAETYPIGTIVPDIILYAWEAQDTAEAWQVAQQQAHELGEPRLTDGLFAVVYQLGINWHTVHTNTWRLLQEGRWRAAAKEAKDSNWYRQTPLRVKDFQSALRALR